MKFQTGEPQRRRAKRKSDSSHEIKQFMWGRHRSRVLMISVGISTVKGI